MKEMSILVIAVILAGCGPTYQLGHERGNIDCKEAFTIAKDRNAVLTLRNGTRLEGSLTKLTADTLEFLEEDEGTSMSLAVGQARSIVMPGAKVWTGILGMVSGTVVGVLISENGSRTDDPLEHLISGFMGRWVMGAGIGGTSGYVLGRMLGPSTTIVFASPHDLQADSQAEEERARAVKLHEEDSVKNAERITLTVSKVTEAGGFVSFVVGSRDITLPIGEVKLERVREGVRLSASRGTFKSGGLILK